MINAHALLKLANLRFSPLTLFLIRLSCVTSVLSQGPFEEMKCPWPQLAHLVPLTSPSSAPGIGNLTNIPHWSCMLRLIHGLCQRVMCWRIHVTHSAIHWKMKQAVRFFTIRNMIQNVQAPSTSQSVKFRIGFQSVCLLFYRSFCLLFYQCYFCIILQ